MLVVLGGTFDPVHLGHISIATQVREQLDVATVQLMPCAQPVHRHPTNAQASDRLAMLELAVAGHVGLQVNGLELQRGGQSYTVDTLRLLREQTDDTLIFVTGSDAFNGFATWKEPEQILSLANLVICHRPDVPINEDLYANRRIFSIDALKNSSQGKIYAMPVRESPCSSTAVRKAIEQGKQPTDCLTASVLHYITERNLYRSHGA